MLTVEAGTSLLRFGSLELTSRSPDGMYVLQVLDKEAGTNLAAAPDPVTATMKAFLEDGAIVMTTGHEDVTLPIAIQVLDGPLAESGEGIPLGVAALTAQCRATWDGRVVPLRWLPAAGHGPASTFKVTAAKLGEVDWDDLAELDPEHRGAIFMLELTCAPWAFADASVTEVIPAPTATDPVTPTVTTIDDCSALTKWARTPTAGTTLTTGTDASGDTYVAAMATSNLTGPIALSWSSSPGVHTDKYLRIKFGAQSFPKTPPGGRPAGGYEVRLDGAVATPVAQSGDVSWYEIPGNLLSSVTITASYPDGTAGLNSSVVVYDLSSTDMVSTVTLTQRQVTRQFEVQGSVRTPASISVRGVNVSDQTDAALGQVIVYTTRMQDVAIPSLRGARYDPGAETTDATAYSGKSSSLTTMHLFHLPINSVAEAGYMLAVRVQSAMTGPRPVTWEARTIVGGVTVSDVATGTTNIDFAAVNTWQVAAAGLLSLPPALAGAAGIVEISLRSPSTLTLDDAWLLDMDHGRVSWLDAKASTRLWVDAPTFETPTPLIWVGTQADRSDAYVPGSAIGEMQPHEVVGGGPVNIFVASGAPAEVGLSYTPAGLGRAPRVAV